MVIPVLAFLSTMSATVAPDTVDSVATRGAIMAVDQIEPCLCVTRLLTGEA